MRNTLFCGQNAGNTMRNALSSFISHSIAHLIYRWLSRILWEHEKWKWKIIFSMRRNERHFSYIFRIRNKLHQHIGQYESQCIDW